MIIASLAALIAAVYLSKHPPAATFFPSMNIRTAAVVNRTISIALICFAVFGVLNNSLVMTSGNEIATLDRNYVGNNLPSGKIIATFFKFVAISVVAWGFIGAILTQKFTFIITGVSLGIIFILLPSILMPMHVTSTYNDKNKCLPSKNELIIERNTGLEYTMITIQGEWAVAENMYGEQKHISLRDIECPNSG